MKPAVMMFGLLLALLSWSPTVRAQAAPASCVFSVTGPIRKLYTGATLERLELSASSALCLKKLTDAGRVRLVNGSSELSAGASASPSGVAIVELGEIPGNLVLGSHDWEIKAELNPTALIGTARLEVAGPAVTVASDSNSNPRLKVSYGPPELDIWHTQESADGYAVVTNLKGEQIAYIRNEARLQRAAELETAAREIAQRRTPEADRCGELWAKASCAWKNDPGKDASKRCVKAAWTCASPLLGAEATELEECSGRAREDRVAQCEDIIERGEYEFEDSDSRLIDAWRDRTSPWTLTATTWPKELWFYEPGWWYEGEARQGVSSVVRFAVMSAQTEPLHADLDLRDGDQVLLRTRLVLAKGARYETLPLPLADALEVRCGKMPNLDPGQLCSPVANATPASPKASDRPDTILNNETRAVDDADVEAGHCFVLYCRDRALKDQVESLGGDRGDPKKPETRTNLQRALLAVYGQQKIVITISRGGTVREWPEDLQPTQNKLFRVPSLKEGSGVYAVSVRAQGPSSPKVTYRSGTPQAEESSARVVDLGDFEFKANLRPRGHLGWRSAPIRTFVTFPLRFTGFRFPAKSSEMKTSSDNTAVQVSTIKAGAMLALEPWNYDTDKNYWVIPTRFMAGFNLYDLSDGRFSPAFLAGASLTFPILQTASTGGTGNLGTDIAIGAFWEVDLEKRDPLSDGNHLLLTLGVDVLTLFAK